ncbi:MAG: low molecular weight phosphotyrosine protein phosphatase [Actinomycetota bacterium]|nr:low molecular weight phosphotyrosine protein phosphatase [Actinomycetota bacterium]
MKIVFVCTGNICRSPMGEAMLRHELAARGCNDVEVSSCGTWGLVRQPATTDAVTTLSGRGIDLASHRSRALDAAEIASADLVVAMTSVHVREIAAEVPGALPKVRLVKELAELRPDAGTGLAGLLAAPRPEPRRSLDVDDPMGLPSRAYERAAGEIEAGVKVLADALCPPEREQ